MDNLVYRMFYTAFNKRIITGLFTRDYGRSLAAISHLENLAEVGLQLGISLPDKSRYLADIREIVEKAIVAEYAAMTETPIDRLDREEVKRISHHYAMERKHIENFQVFAARMLKDLDLKSSPPK